MFSFREHTIQGLDVQPKEASNSAEKSIIGDFKLNENKQEGRIIENHDREKISREDQKQT